MYERATTIMQQLCHLDIKPWVIWIKRLAKVNPSNHEPRILFPKKKKKCNADAVKLHKNAITNNFHQVSGNKDMALYGVMGENILS